MMNEAETLEGIYNDVQLTESLSFYEDNEVIEEGAKEVLDDIREFISKTESIPEFFGNIFKFLRTASLIGIGTGIAAQLLGWIFIGLSRLMDKNLKFKNKVLRQVEERLRNEKIKDLDMDSMAPKELYLAYESIEDELANELEKHFPMKGKTKWAVVLNYVGKALINKIGTTAFALAGFATYSKLADKPTL